MLTVIIKDKAVENIQAAFDYLEQQEKNLGEKLLSKIDEYIEIINHNPHLFKSGYRQVRQVRIQPFQYLLRYKIYKNFVVVIQLFHPKQHPKKKINK